MTTDYLYELQQSIITELAEDATLDAMVNGVYNHVPLDAKFPYVSVDNIVAKGVNTRTTSGFHVGLAIRVFSRTRSGQEASNIIAEIRRVLEAASFSPTGCSITSIREEDDSITRMRDGITWHGNINYIVILQEGEGIFVADGNQLIIKTGDGAAPTEAFATIGGIRGVSITLANKTLDATGLSSGKWRDLVSGAGIASVSISGVGFFSDSVAEEVLRANAFAGSVNNYQLLLGNGDIMSGGFMVTAYKRNGDSKGEEEFAVMLESSGTVVLS